MDEVLLVTGCDERRRNIPFREAVYRRGLSVMTLSRVRELRAGIIGTVTFIVVMACFPLGDGGSVAQ